MNDLTPSERAVLFVRCITGGIPPGYGGDAMAAFAAIAGLSMDEAAAAFDEAHRAGWIALSAHNQNEHNVKN